MCGRCNCCPGFCRRITPQLGVNGLDPADPTSGYKLAKRVVVYMALTMFVIFNLVCAVLFFGVGGGISGGKWYLLLLPYQMFLIILIFGVGTIHMIQKAGVPCPMRVRGFVLYPQNTIQTTAKQPADVEKAVDVKVEETQIKTPYSKAVTMPSKNVWMNEV